MSNPNTAPPLDYAPPLDPTDQVPVADSLLLRWVEIAHTLQDPQSSDRADLINETLDYLVEQEDRRAGE